MLLVEVWTLCACIACASCCSTLLMAMYVFQFCQHSWQAATPACALLLLCTMCWHFLCLED